MSTDTRREEQLARIRRNQQRCRDRKRAHLNELQTQVHGLQEQLNNCTPCPLARAQSTAAQLEDLRTQNEGRRDLLRALGFTDEMQQTFLDSAAQRRALAAELQQESTDLPSIADHTTLQIEEVYLDDVLFQTMLDDAALQDLAVEAEIESGSGTTDLVDLDPGSLAMIDRSSCAPLRNPTAIASLARSPEETSGYNDAWSQAEVSSPQPHISTPSKTALEASISQCFLETAIDVHSDRATIACSVAIRIILQFNKKGLTLGQLNERLKPGYCLPGKTKECHLKDSVFVDLLTELTAR